MRMGRMLAWTLFLAALGTLLGLGIWQLERRDWKEALLAQAEARLAEPARPLVPADLADPESARWRRVTVSGEALPGHVLVFGQRREGEAGHHLVTLLRLPGGGLLAVRQGWVPEGWTPPAAEAAPGPVALTGTLSPFPSPGPLSPADPVTADGQLLRPDRDALARLLGQEPAALLPLLLTRSGPAAAPPLPLPSAPDMPRNHGSYALTWFSLAFILCVIFLLRIRRAKA